MLFFWPSFVNCCPSPLLSGLTLPPSPLPSVNKYTVYMCTVCKGGIWGSGPQTDKHLLQSPFTGQFFEMTTFYILHCFLWVLSFYAVTTPEAECVHMDCPQHVNVHSTLFALHETVGIELERSAIAKLAGFSDSLLNREGTIVYRKVFKREDWRLRVLLSDLGIIRLLDERSRKMAENVQN